MRRIYIVLVALCFTSYVSPIQAQIKEKVKSIIASVSDSTTNNQIGDSLVKRDSTELSGVKVELQEANLAKMELQMEIEQMRLKLYSSDSLKIVAQKLRIDSIRGITVGFPVVVEGDTLFTIFAHRGGLSAHYRATAFSTNILDLGKKYNIDPDSLYLEHSENVTDIMYDSKVLVSITDFDALWQNTNRDELAETYRILIIKKLKELKEEYSIIQLVKRISYFALVIILQCFLFWLTSYLFRKLHKYIIRLKDTRLRPVKFGDYELLTTQREVRLLLFASNITRYLIVLIQLVITVPILFIIFPQTEGLALKIFSYLWHPIRGIVLATVDYIPNLFIIFIIFFMIKYIIKGIKYLASEIETEHLKISGFYPDWAQPSFQIIRFLMYAFMIAMIYPYLPGSKSGVFQGISIFVGLIVSLGSSTVIGNIIAGMVITYMRPFKIGDRIKLNDTTGNVIEKTPFVTRLRTPKNELVTIPNSFIMSSHTVNYSASARNFGLIIHTEVTIGYDAKWRQVHQLLIDAALSTKDVNKEPLPFVLETALSDNYPVYQINAYISDADKLAIISSDLHQNIQDKFNEAGVEIMSPHYYSHRNGNESTIPKEDTPKEKS
ncbi:MAG: mechanosensitive ion channel family protein [Muribaculaceae bacterium]